MLTWFRRPPKPLTAAEIRFLHDEIPFFASMEADRQDLLLSRIPTFLKRYPFEGCDGISVVPEMKLVVAAYACRMRLGHEDDRFSDLKRILLYPDDFRVPVREADEVGIVTEGTEWRSGESWHQGYVVLSWREIGYDLEEAWHRLEAGPRHGAFPARNLIVHEFAHQLDFSYGLTTGVDPDTGYTYRDDPWTLALAEAYRSLDAGFVDAKRPALDDYGAEAPAELFAVACEAWFETPDQLRRQYGELAKALEGFFEG